MKSLFIVIVFFFCSNNANAQTSERSLLDETTATLRSDKLSRAQDAEEIRDLVRTYIDVLNARDSTKLAQEVFMASAQVATFVLPTTSDIKELFDRLYLGMGPNWDHSVIKRIDICVAGPGLAFVDLNYSRIDDVGEPIQPAERATFLIIRKLEEHWRISGAHPHDATRKVTC